MSDVLGRLAALAPGHRAELMKRLRSAPRPAARAGQERPHSAGRDAPLSPAQVRLWLLQRIDPSSPVYNLAVTLYLDGPLNVPVLQDALSEIVRRHETLRTAFPEVDGSPVQRILPPAPVRLAVQDLQHLPQGERNARAHQVSVTIGRRPIDLERPPLARFGLVKLGPRHHALTIVIHHLIADGWSLTVFAAEIAELYRAFEADRPSPLPELQVQYSDLMPRHRGGNQAAADQLEYWTGLLRGNLPVLDLPTDRPRPARQTFSGARRPLEWSRELTSALKAEAARNGQSLFSLLLANFAVVLGQASGQEDLIIGTALAARESLEAEAMIGFFVNTLPLRLDLSRAPTLAEVSSKARDVTRGALAHQSVSLDQLVHALQPPRDPARPVLRQAAFVLQHMPPALVEAGRVTIRIPGPIEVDLGFSRLDLSLYAWEEAGQLHGYLEYNTDLFDEATVAAWADSLIAVSRQAVTDPQARINIAASSSSQHAGLTESQLMLYFATRYRPDVQLYYEYITAVFIIDADLDAHHLGRAFQALIDRSDSLRSVFEETDGALIRRVADGVRLELDEADLSGAPRPREALRQWVTERRARVDLSSRPFDSALVRLGNECVAWYLNLHHLVSDAWSMSLIARRVSEYYALSRLDMLDRADPLPAYQSYVDYERALRDSPHYRRAKEYWQDKLSRTPARMTFYGEEGTERAASTTTFRVSVELGRERSSKIRDLARKTGLTSPAIVLCGALFAYLYRISGERLLRIGTPFANRPAQFRDTIGLFMNASPVQVELAERGDFLELLRQVQLAFIESARHLQYRVKNPPNDPVYEVYFNYQNSIIEGFGGAVDTELIGSGHSNDLLGLQVRDFGGTGRYQLDFDFNTACFRDQEGEWTAGHYLNLLDAILADPGMKVSAARMLSPAEQARLRRDLNRTSRPYDLEVPLHGWVERQAARTPQAVAVACGDQRLSYAELNASANRLARRMRKLGVAPGELVGVCMERSAELVIGMLAVLKAGGAYLPIDPSYPRQRLAFMLADSGTRVLLTTEELSVRLPRHDAVVVDGHDGEASDEDGHDLGVRVGSGDHAYAIYTSGSTGTPKAALIPHRGICNRLLWMQEEYRLSAHDRVLQKTPFSFDVSVWEFFWPLMTGACLVMARPGGHLDPAYLVDVIKKEGITTAHFVPSMLRVFLDTPGVTACTSLRRVICSGEALPPDLPRKFFSTLPAELHNLYGPTEASVDVTAWECHPDSSLTSVPIGRPVANTRLYVLDHDGNMLPEGIPGELHIGGVQLASGYLRRPQLTQEKFVSHPFMGDERLYRTGDLVRYRRDGAIEFLGRIDDQVKIRGFRIEPGEIEAELLTDPAVRDAAVSVWNGQLVAYVVPCRPECATGELRAHLRRRLPDHMVPAFFVTLPELPVTPNGKLDRKALPAPRVIPAASFTAPGTPVEEALARIWGEVLERDDIGVHDDFFDLGGHSLLAARLMSQIHRRFGMELPLGAIFEAPTIAGLARLIEQGRSAPGRPDGVVLIRPGGNLPPLFVIHPAGGDVMAYKGLADMVPGGRAVIGIESRARYGQPEHASIAEMAAAYAAAIRGRQPAGPYFLLGWSMGGVIAAEVAAALEVRGQRVAFAGLIDSFPAHGPQDRDPLLVPAVALAAAAADLAAVDVSDLADMRAAWRGLGTDERLRMAWAWAADHGLLPADASFAVARQQAELAAAHEDMLLAHHAGLVDCPLTVWWARERPHSRRGDWSRHTRGGVSEETVSGNHFSLLRMPDLSDVGARVAAALGHAAEQGPVMAEGAKEVTR